MMSAMPRSNEKEKLTCMEGPLQFVDDSRNREGDGAKQSLPTCPLAIAEIRVRLLPATSRDLARRNFVDSGGCTG